MPSGTANWLKQPWVRNGILAGLICGLLLGSLGYAFISNVSRAESAAGLVAASLTRPAAPGGSNGVLALMLTTWLIGAFLFVSQPDGLAQTEKEWKPQNWIKAIGLAACLSLLIALVFWMWDAAGLISLRRANARTVEDIVAQVRISEGLLTSFYFQVSLILLGLALFCPSICLREALAVSRSALRSRPGCILLAIVLSSYSNLRIIQADIAFKTGDVFAKPGSWQISIAIYQRANQLAPNEDYYYLFLGRAYLEHAKTLQTALSAKPSSNRLPET